MSVPISQLHWQLAGELEYPWEAELLNGSRHWSCKLERHSLHVDPEPNDLFSFSVADLEGDRIRSEYDFPDEESALKAAESQWENCLKPIPRLSGKGQTFKWNTVEKGSASECRIGMRNSILLQTFRDEESGFWSSCAYCQNVLLLEELEGWKTNNDAQLMLEQWYKDNAVHLLNFHSLRSK